MTRRDFLQRIIIAGSAVAAGCLALAKAVLPKRFLWAKPVSGYPGRLEPLGDIASQSKWSG
ncbi:MAG: hypothetical protein ABSA64_03150 [Sedimentisphaerales bacterium]